MKKKALGTYDIAKICQVAPITVGRWIDEGKLPFFTTGGGHRRVWDEDLVKFLNAHNYPVPADLKLSQKKTLLIVDDDPAIRKMIRRVIEKEIEDVNLQDAANGFEAGEMISSLLPSLVILDIRLPGMDGFAVCKRIRLNKALKKIKILAISGDTSKEMRDKSIKAGADAFLAKNDLSDELSALTKKLLK